MSKFNIVLEPSGESADVSADEYLLDGLEAAGVTPPSGCRYGSCGECAARLLRGEVDQSEGSALYPEEIAEGWALLCIARPLTDCLIQLETDSTSVSTTASGTENVP